MATYQGLSAPGNERRSKAQRRLRVAHALASLLGGGGRMSSTAGTGGRQQPPKQYEPGPGPGQVHDDVAPRGPAMRNQYDPASTLPAGAPKLPPQHPMQSILDPANSSVAPSGPKVGPRAQASFVGGRARDSRSALGLGQPRVVDDVRRRQRQAARRARRLALRALATVDHYGAGGGGEG